MSGAGTNHVMRWMALWGWMDLANVAFSIGSNIYRGRFPVFEDLSNVFNTHQMYGGMLPLLVSITSTLLFFSFIASGYLLVRGNNLGRYLAFTQMPFRIIFIMPSLFFLGSAYSISSSLSVFAAILVFTEIVKLWSIRRRPSRD